MTTGKSKKGMSVKRSIMPALLGTSIVAVATQALADSSALVAAGDTAAAQSPQSQTVTQPTGRASDLQELVVTAERIKERLQDVPVSIIALSGDAFDMEYLSFMVKDHHKDLHAFRLEAASHTDQSLHDEVVKAGGVIHEHTVMVDKLARAKGVPVPPHGGNKAAPAPTL